MIKTLKYHLRSLSIIVIIAMIYTTIKTVGILVISITLPSSQLVKFTDVIKSEFFQKGFDNPNNWIAIIFIIMLTILNLYLLKLLLISYKLIKEYKNGELLTDEITKKLTLIGEGFLNYGLSYAALFMIIGVFFYNNVSSITDVLPRLIVCFIFGKSILLLAAISKKGVLLKQENDLTI